MLSMNVPVDEFITPDPVTAREDMSIDEVRSLMDRHDIRHLPVMRGNAVVGLISERDVRLVSGLTVAEKLMVNASDIMTTVLLTVGASTPLVEVAHAMARQKVGSAIVNDEDGRLLGIFTATDNTVISRNTAIFAKDIIQLGFQRIFHHFRSDFLHGTGMRFCTDFPSHLH